MILRYNEINRAYANISSMKNYVLAEGYFWDCGLQLYTPNKEKTQLISLKLPLNPIVELAKESFPKFTEFIPHPGAEPDEYRNTIAYGTSDDCAIMIKPEDKIIKDISFFVLDLSSEDKDKMIKFIHGLSKFEDLMFDGDLFQSKCNNKQAIKVALDSMDYEE